MICLSEMWVFPEPPFLVCVSRAPPLVFKKKLLGNFFRGGGGGGGKGAVFGCSRYCCRAIERAALCPSCRRVEGEEGGKGGVYSLSYIAAVVQETLAPTSHPYSVGTDYVGFPPTNRGGRGGVLMSCMAVFV